MFCCTDLNSSLDWVVTFPPQKEITQKNAKDGVLNTALHIRSTLLSVVHADLGHSTSHRGCSGAEVWCSERPALARMECSTAALFSVLNKLYLNLLNKVMVSKSQNTPELHYQRQCTFGVSLIAWILWFLEQKARAEWLLGDSEQIRSLNLISS